MRSAWIDIAARERETRAYAERLELRIHALALTLTAIVLAMRLVAGMRDLTLDESTSEPSSAGELAEGVYAYGI